MRWKFRDPVVCAIGCRCLKSRVCLDGKEQLVAASYGTRGAKVGVDIERLDLTDSGYLDN